MGDKFYRTVLCCHWSLLNKTGHYFSAISAQLIYLQKPTGYFSIFLNCFLAHCFVIHIELLSYDFELLACYYAGLSQFVQHNKLLVYVIFMFNC